MRRLSPNTKKGFMLIEVLVVVLRNMSLKELMNLSSQAVNFEKQENVWRAE